MKAKLRIWTHGRYAILVGIFLAVAGLVAGMVFAATGGIDQNGLFELDGDATANNASSPYGQFDDWSNMPSSNAAFDAWTGILPDPGRASSGTNVNDDTTFMGGGSKDTHDISAWRWNAGSIPAKDDITNAYATAYTKSGHLIIYFGADRFANNGSAQLGFWFLQKKLPKPLPADGTFGTATHTAAVGGVGGDLLVLANFTQGGSLSGFEVLQWVGTGGDQKGGTLHTLIAPESAQCDTDAADARGCAISNTDPVKLYWSYSAKFPVTDPFPAGTCTSTVNCAPTASFFEGGVDVTALLGTTPCLGSFLVESRSSSGSVTAQLEDFVYDNFSLCGFNVNKACGGGTPDGDSIQYTFGGVVRNEHGGISDVTVTDTFPSDATNISPAGTTGAADYVRSYDVGTVDANNCQTWPTPLSGSEGHGFPCADLGSITQELGTFDTKTNAATNSVTGATANGGTVTGTKTGGGPLPYDATCPTVPGASLTASKRCSVSISSRTLVITVGTIGSVCNTSGYNITHLAGTDVQTDDSFVPLSGVTPSTLAFKNNSNTTTTTLDACTEPSGDCNTTNQGTYPNTCATFTDSYTPSRVSGGTTACTDDFADRIDVSGNYLGGSGDTNKVTQAARAKCKLCDCSGSP